MSKKIDKVEDEIDFGFSFVDDDLDEIKREKIILEDDSKTLQNRLDSLFNTILPFLNNLKQNPEKSTIHWPNRAKKIDTYIEKLREIAYGEQK